VILTTIRLAKVGDKLAVSKQTTCIFHIKRFNFKPLNEVEGKEQYRFDMLGWQFWKIYTLKRVLLELEKQLERISKFQPKESRLV
jgi:hypothetical protein